MMFWDLISLERILIRFSCLPNVLDYFDLKKLLRQNKQLRWKKKICLFILLLFESKCICFQGIFQMMKSEQMFEDKQFFSLSSKCDFLFFRDFASCFTNISSDTRKERISPKMFRLARNSISRLNEFFSVKIFFVSFLNKS